MLSLDFYMIEQEAHSACVSQKENVKNCII